MSTTPVDFSQYEDKPAQGGSVDFSKYETAPTGATPLVPKQTSSALFEDKNNDFKNMLTGAAEGAANTVGSTVSGVSHLLHKMGDSRLFNPMGYQNPVPEEGIRALEARTQDRSTPQNTSETIGKTGEQIGEWMLPSGAEEHAGALAGRLLPRAGKAIPLAARVGTQAIETGLRNSSQGGDFKTGAEAGAAGGVIGEGLRAAAPAIAESAMGIRKNQRGYGKTPGIAILNETKGLTPATVGKTANAVTDNLTKGINASAASHPGTVSLQPAIDAIDAAIGKATNENDATTVEQLGKVKDAITKQVGPGTAIPIDQPATGALNLKRGLRNQFIKNWNPELMSGTRAVAANAAHAIDSGLDRALGPSFTDANQRISSLIPVTERAESLERDPSLAQKMGHRLAAHTGALVGSYAGGREGYERGGIPGAVIGGVSGLAIPELLASPAAQMAVARAAHSPAIPLAIAKGAALQLNRNSSKDKGGSEKKDEE